MIYRIAIYRTINGIRMFDHYAVDKSESDYLRVSEYGVVEKVILDGTDGDISEWVIEPNAEVEWIREK